MSNLALVEIQKIHKEWADRNFGSEGDGTLTLLGIQEELGELTHAHLKAKQGIRGTQEQHFDAKVDAVADIMLYLLDYCNRQGIDAYKALVQTAHKVWQRDWKRNPQDGRVDE